MCAFFIIVRFFFVLISSKWVKKFAPNYVRFFCFKGGQKSHILIRGTEVGCFLALILNFSTVGHGGGASYDSWKIFIFS